MRYCRRTLKRIVANSDRFPIWTPVILYCTVLSFHIVNNFFWPFGEKRRDTVDHSIFLFLQPTKAYGFIKLFIQYYIVICRTSEPGTAVQRKGH